MAFVTRINPLTHHAPFRRRCCARRRLGRCLHPRAPGAQDAVGGEARDQVPPPPAPPRQVSTGSARGVVVVIDPRRRRPRAEDGAADVDCGGSWGEVCNGIAGGDRKIRRAAFRRQNTWSRGQTCVPSGIRWGAFGVRFRWRGGWWRSAWVRNFCSE